MASHDAVEKQMSKVFSKILGMDEIKSHMEKLMRRMVNDKMRSSLGVKVAREPPHMAFYGYSGTGKSTLARIIGKLLHMVGFLSTDEVVEVRVTELITRRFIGLTSRKTRNKIREANGGILFVDEADSLFSSDSDDMDCGGEVLREIISSMDTGNVVVIFAYESASNRWRDVKCSYSGPCSWVLAKFNFENYSCEQLAEILHLKMCNQDKDSPFYGFKLHPSCTLEAVAATIQRKKNTCYLNNAYIVDQMLTEARQNLDSRIGLDFKDDAESLVTFTLADFESGVKSK